MPMPSGRAWVLWREQTRTPKLALHLNSLRVKPAFFGGTKGGPLVRVCDGRVCSLRFLG